MYIALAKRKENIAEYILYLWQLEDMLRALQFNRDLIFEYLVDKQESLSDEQKLELLNWYVELSDLLKSEDKLESGHIEHTLHLINDLYNLHLQLQVLPVGEKYKAVFQSVKPHIETLRKKMGADDISDIEICFRALYSVMLLRMKGLNEGEDKSNSYIDDVLELISPFIASLSSYYHKVESGLIDLSEGE